MRFVFVDEILEMVPGKTVHAVKTLPPGETLFADHFPGFPVVPGVLLVEMMAQASGKCLDADESTRGKAMLVQIRRGFFRRWVHPGEQLHIHGVITSTTPVSATADGRIVVDGGEVASAELLFAFLPVAQFAADFRDEVLERFLAARRNPGSDV